MAPGLLHKHHKPFSFFVAALLQKTEVLAFCLAVDIRFLHERFDFPHHALADPLVLIFGHDQHVQNLRRGRKIGKYPPDPDQFPAGVARGNHDVAMRDRTCDPRRGIFLLCTPTKLKIDRGNLDGRERPLV